ASRARPDMTVVDVTVPIRDAMTVYRGNPPVRIRPAMTLRKDGVNLSELCLGSHTGTHVDAPSHFIRGGAGADRLALDRFIGPARGADPQASAGRGHPDPRRSRPFQGPVRPLADGSATVADRQWRRRTNPCCALGQVRAARPDIGMAVVRE